MYWTRPKDRWKDKTPPGWVLWLSPDLLLKPSERYSLRLYISIVLRPMLFTLSCIAISYCTGASVFWKNPTHRNTFQGFFQNPHMKGHTQVIDMMLGMAVFLVVVPPLLLALIGFVVHFPRYYFWNRRAARIAHEKSGNATTIDTITEDATSWPPPPKLTAQ